MRLNGFRRQHDIRAVTRAPERNFASDTAARAGDKDGLALQLSHFPIPRSLDRRRSAAKAGVKRQAERDIESGEPSGCMVY
jgi:hypothetical protein